MQKIINKESIYNLAHNYSMDRYLKSMESKRLNSYKGLITRKISIAPWIPLDKELKKYPSKTLGPPPIFDPQCITKKGDNNKFLFLRKKKEIVYDNENIEHFPINIKVPSHKVSKRKIGTVVNYINQNIIDAVTNPVINYSAERQWRVDSPNGTRKPQISVNTTSGCIKIYVHKPGFGEVPSYIIKRKKAVEKTRELEMLIERDNIQAMKPDYRKLTEEERSSLLLGLRNNYLIANKRYQSIPVHCDTISLIRERKALEKKLDDLQCLVDEFSVHEHIYVENPPFMNSITKT